jgi:NO-binding membrane sensor protein with MHYT domain
VILIPMAITESRYLVALSILIATFASYAAFELGGRVTAARGHAHRMWLVAAAVTMGGGIWSTHFIAMLESVMPIPVSYDIELTILSLGAAVVLVGAAFFVISRDRGSAPGVVLGGVFMGVGIAVTHFTGDAAMRGDVTLSYGGLDSALSVLVAIGASTAALWLAFRGERRGHRQLASLVMGLAIVGMHYAVTRATFVSAHVPVHEFQGISNLDPTSLALVVANVTFLILAVAVIAALADQGRAERALRETQAELARVTRITSMRELTGSLAEEINQPIAGAVTNAYACVRWLGGKSPNIEEARACAVRIAEDGTRAAEIIKRIHLFCQRGVPQREFVDVNGVIRDMIVLLQGEVVRHCISVRTELGADLPQVCGDQVQLQLVVMNLIMNSIDAMKGVDGTRELAITSQRADGDQVMVCVSDTGVGLPPQHTFRALFTTKPDGFGMGLSISRSIIESHRGRLWAADNVPRGASFHIVLPTSVQVLTDDGDEERGQVERVRSML